MAGQHALAKLRQFQFKQPQHYALPLYSSALAAGARRVRAGLGKQGFFLEHDGGVLRLEGLLDTLLDGGSPALYELALGVNGALACEGRVSVVSGDRQGTWFLSPYPDRRLLLEVGPHTGPRVQGVRVLVARPGLKVDELVALRERAGYSPMRLEMPEGPGRAWMQALAVRELVGRGSGLHSVEAGYASRAEHEGEFSVQVAVFAQPVDYGIVWSRWGVGLRHEKLPYQHVAVRVADPHLQRDASLADVVVDERYRAVEDAVWAQLDVLLAELHERELGQGELMPYGPLCAELIQRVEHRSFVLENRALAEDDPPPSYWAARGLRLGRPERLRADLGLHCLRAWVRGEKASPCLARLEEVAGGSPRYLGAVALMGKRWRPKLDRATEALLLALAGSFTQVSELLDAPENSREFLLAADAALARERWDTARQLYTRAKGRAGLLGEAQVARRLGRFGDLEGRLLRERDSALTNYLMKGPVAPEQADFAEVAQRHAPGSLWRTAARDYLVTCLVKAGRYQAAGVVLAEGRREEELLVRLGSRGDGREFGPQD